MSGRFFFGLTFRWRGANRRQPLAGRFAAPAAVGKRVDTCGFQSLVNHPFPLEGMAKIGERRLRKRGTAEDFFYRKGAQCAPISLPLRSARYFAATQTGCFTQERHKVTCPYVQQYVICELRKGGENHATVPRLPFPLFRSGRRSLVCARLSKGKG